MLESDAEVRTWLNTEEALSYEALKAIQSLQTTDKRRLVVLDPKRQVM